MFPEYLEFIIRKIIEFLLHFFYIFPLQKNKILFYSFNGKQYSCNPKYIYEYLQKHEKNRYDCIWCFSSNRNYQGIKYFKKSNLLSFCFHNLTAGIIITNCQLTTLIPYRKKQIMIFTGHGGGSYKKCGIDDKKLSFLKKHFYNKSGKMVSYAISPSMMTSKDYNTEYNIDDGRILNFGAPRNDIFFSDRPDIIKKTKELYNIDEITHIVLFAPTFRGAADSASTINLYKVKNIMDALYNRFGQKFVLMVRAHHTIKASLLENDNEILDGNLIDDMQELLYTCDILITDYSSCMWDCCIAGKPLFLYTPDVVEYEKERGLTIPISQWGFPLAKTLDELIKNITDFNYDLHKKAIIEHKLLMGSYETGTATESCVRLINNLTCNVQ